VSKLYDAIARIEKNQKTSEALPDFHKRKPPYVLLISTAIFVLVIVVSAVLVREKIDGISRKMPAVHKEPAAKKAINRHKIATVTSDFVNPEFSKRKIVIKIKHKLALKQNGLVNKSENKPVVFPTPKAASLNKNRNKVKKTVIKKVAKVQSVSNKVRKIEAIGAAIEKEPEGQDSLIVLINNSKSADNRTAIAAYRALIRQFPNNPDLYNNLAARYIRIDRYKEAIGLLKKALKIKDDPAIRINLAISYIKQGNYQMARVVMNDVTFKNAENLKKAGEIEEFLDRVENK